MSTLKDYLEKAGSHMESSLHAFEREISHLRAGRASTALVDHIKVTAYGAEMPMNQLATVTTPDATTIAIVPYDKGNLNAIEKALRLSELNLTPMNDGTTVRLTLPPLTEDRRKELIKLVHKHAEESRVALRNVRRDANDHIKKLAKNKECSEDEMHDALAKVDKILERELESLEKTLKAKEKEITDF
jgi:ribosome recycling factor